MWKFCYGSIEIQKYSWDVSADLHASKPGRKLPAICPIQQCMIRSGYLPDKPYEGKKGLQDWESSETIA